MEPDKELQIPGIMTAVQKVPQIASFVTKSLTPVPQVSPIA